MEGRELGSDGELHGLPGVGTRRVRGLHGPLEVSTERVEENEPWRDGPHRLPEGSTERVEGRERRRELGPMVHRRLVPEG